MMQTVKIGWRRALCTLLMLPVLALAAGGAYGAQADAATDLIGTFEIEQVYANVPEMDIFVYALDSSGNSLSPQMAQAAGVTVKLGDATIPTGTISQAAEPICYIFAIDNSAGISKQTMNAYKKSIRRVIANKGKQDQIVLYTLAGGVKCVRTATDSDTEALVALNHITLADEDNSNVDITGAAATIYADAQQDFQSLAPRRVVMTCTDSGQVLTNLTLMGSMLSGASSQLNMAVYTFITAESGDRLTALEKLSNGRVIICTPDKIADAMQEKQTYMGKALELKTAIDDTFYGQKLDVLTVSVPALGSAVKTSTTVYMGNRLQTPAVAEVQVQDRTHLLVRFNQAVSNAELPRSYRLACEDVWGWRPQIKAVELSSDNMSAVLTTEPLYSGTFTVTLRKVTSKMTPANISNSKALYRFQIDDWARDKDFYFARFRLPLLLAALLLGALAVSVAVQKRRDKAAEQQAEAEHLLQNGARAPEVALPTRWLTLFVKPYRAVAETRWTATVKSSLLVGSDPAQCDLCINDSRVGAQHCMLCIEGDTVLVRALGEHMVRVNDQRIGDAHRLKNNDCIKIGRSTLRFVT